MQPGRIYFIFLLLFSMFGYAQRKDAAVWENIYLEKRITERFLIHLNHEGRINNNITRLRYGYADVGITYVFNKHFHSCLDYVFLDKYTDKRGANFYNQLYVTLTYKQKIKPFKIYYRQMLQGQNKNIYSSNTGRYPEYLYRNKLTIKMDLYRFIPYVASEIYFKLSNSYYKDPEDAEEVYGPHFNKVRYFAGMFYELNKMNFLEVYYLVEQHLNRVDPLTNYVIGIGYAHGFY